MQYLEIPNVKDIEEGISKMRAGYAANEDKVQVRLTGFLCLKDGEKEKRYVYGLHSLICDCTGLEKEDAFEYTLEFDNFYKKLVEGYAKFGGRKFQALNRFTACICESSDQVHWFINNSMPFVERVKKTEQFFKQLRNWTLAIGLILVTWLCYVQYKQYYKTVPQANKVLRLGTKN